MGSGFEFLAHEFCTAADVWGEGRTTRENYTHFRSERFSCNVWQAPHRAGRHTSHSPYYMANHNFFDRCTTCITKKVQELTWHLHCTHVFIFNSCGTMKDFSSFKVVAFIGPSLEREWSQNRARRAAVAAESSSSLEIYDWGASSSHRHTLSYIPRSFLMIHESLLFRFNSFQIIGFSLLYWWASGRADCLVTHVIEKELIETIGKLKNN